MIATIGPASQNVDTLVRLLEAGVTCCRVDLTVRAAAPALVPRLATVARHNTAAARSYAWPSGRR